MSVLMYTSRSITSLENLLLQASQLCGLHIEHVGDGERMTGLGAFGSDNGHRWDSFTNRSDSLPEINSDSILSYPIRKPNIYSESNFTVRSHYKMGAGTPHENGEYLPGSCDNWDDTDSLGSFTNRQRPTCNAPFPELNSESIFLYSTQNTYTCLKPYFTESFQNHFADRAPSSSVVVYPSAGVKIAESASFSDAAIEEESSKLSSRPFFVPRLDLSFLNDNREKADSHKTHRVLQIFNKKNKIHVVPTGVLVNSTSSSEISGDFLHNTFTANRFKTGQDNAGHPNGGQDSGCPEISQNEKPKRSLKKRITKFFSGVFGCWKRKE